MEIHFVENPIWLLDWWRAFLSTYISEWKFDEISDDLLVLRWKSDLFEVLETRWYKAALWIDIPIKLQFFSLQQPCASLSPKCYQPSNRWHETRDFRPYRTLPSFQKIIARLTTLHDFKPLQFLQVSSSRSGRARVPNEVIQTLNRQTFSKQSQRQQILS